MAGVPSAQIGQKAAQTNYYAEIEAERIGLPFTHMVTINYAHTAIDPRLAVASFSKLRRAHFNKWATRPRRGAGVAFPPTYCFAFENVRGDIVFDSMEVGDDHNVHVHWGLHLPGDRLFDFEQLIWEWVDRTTGGIIQPIGAIHIADSDGSLGGYLVKGASATSVRFYGRGRQQEPQGIIVGRRADTSRNIGPSVRRAHDRALGIMRQLPRARSCARPSHPPVGW